MRVIPAILSMVLLQLAASSDIFYMEMLSAHIQEADIVSETATQRIPALAGSLGLNTLVELVTKAGLVKALNGKGPLTVFGPTDDAFANLPPPFAQLIAKNITLLTDILSYHVVAAEAFSKDLTNDQLVQSLQGKNIRINIYKKSDSTVITASGRVVSSPDNAATNGVIHVTGGVLLPPAGTLTDVVVKCPAFSTLLTAVKTAGLADTLAGEGPFTLFAPTDKAFAKIPKLCLAALLKCPWMLKKVLLYHVVPSTQYSAGLSCGDKLKTVEGSDVKITRHEDQFYVNWAQVIYADATVTNGVMHAINSVLIPLGEMDEFCASVPGIEHADNIMGEFDFSKDDSANVVDESDMVRRLLN